MINYILQIFIGILLLIISAFDVSEGNHYFLFYSKEKTFLLFVHIFLLFVIIILGFISKWKIPNNIQAQFQSLAKNSILFSIVINISLSFVFLLFWINTYSGLLSYWYLFEKLLPFLIWISFGIIHIVGLCFSYLISNVKINVLDYTNQNLNSIIPTLGVSVFLLLLVGNTLPIVNRELIYTLSTPFNLFSGVLYCIILVFVLSFYSYLLNTDALSKPTINKFSIINFASIFILILTGQFLRFSESFFSNWNDLLLFFDLKPIIYFIFTISMGVLLSSIFFQFKNIHFEKASFGNKWIYISLGFLFIIFSSLIYFSGFVRIPDDQLWNGAGNPINFAQIAYSLLFVIFFIFVSLLFNKKKQKYFSLLFVLGVMLFTILIWQWAPDFRNYFIQPPVKPNFMYFPYSDARGFDFGGQFVRYGFGIENNLDNTYPFTMFLTHLYHLISKQNFILTYQIQMVLMILLPVGIYFIGKLLDSKKVGLFTAALILFQEGNAIRLSGEINNVHIQLLMSEIPTLLCLVWGTYFFISGVKKHETIDFVLSGLILGFASLCRLNPLFVVAAYSLVLLFYVIIKKGLWKTFMSFTSSFFIIFMGWYLYLYKITGYFYFWDKMQSILRRTQAHVPHSTHRLSLTISPLNQFFIEIFDTLSTLFNHFLHNLFNSFISLPMSFATSNPVQIDNFIFKFWDPYLPWDGRLSGFEICFVFINLFLITFGIAQLWKKNTWKSLIPLLLLFSYAGALGAARTSGGRYLTPINWVLLFYYGCGIWYVFKIFIPNLPFVSLSEDSFFEPATKNKIKIIGSILLLIVLLLMMSWPFFTPDRVVLAEEDIIQQFEIAYEENNIPLEKLKEILNDKDVYIIDAIALYPIINDDSILFGHLIHDEFLDFYFAFRNDNLLKLPHDQQVYMIGYKLSYKDFSVHQYIFMDANGEWQVFIADETRLFDVLDE